MPTSSLLLSPERIGRLLQVGHTWVYTHLPVSEHGALAIPAAAVVRLMNAARTNPTMPELDEPIPLLTEEQVRHLVTVDGSPATVAQVRRFARRKLFPIPAFDLAPTVVRFPYGAVEWWLSYLDSPVAVRFRTYSYGIAPRSSTSRTHAARAGSIRPSRRPAKGKRA